MQSKYYLKSFFQEAETASKQGELSISITHEQWVVIEQVVEALGFVHLETDKNNDCHIIGWVKISI